MKDKVLESDDVDILLNKDMTVELLGSSFLLGTIVIGKVQSRRKQLSAGIWLFLLLFLCVRLSPSVHCHF